ncbi:Ubiquinone biosynthesis O-methyltransferase [Caulifigura coniformis]|uniref:Ubiquinone biosynthesis O-methyltransferase n=1 Tax=Caulifigura coniformis TaxID=2527983 RepID=A0A517SE11_9PLAN|nr:class I SAM-dependent methyltransferase [Caulifigura coniformis]QDT54372.1 Ubiquinone biosynthesis O-methyltransferase [Caulifigura coniformis]
MLKEQQTLLRLPRPLTSAGDLVTALADCTGDSRQMVLSRLVDEIRCSGINVRREAEDFKLEPYVWSDRLLEFYRDSTAFAYETVVWNRSRLKQSIRQWMGDFLRRSLAPGSRVLVYGDGLGFDSAGLAAMGLSVTSLEPSDRGRRFAAGVFRQNGVTVRQASGDGDLPVDPFDAIVCLDVLEHVPSPPDMLSEFHRRLRPDGVLIVSAPFFCTEPFRPTHLAANRRYSGDLGLYRRAGFSPLGGDYFWEPIAFRKGRAGSLLETGLLRLGQPLLMTGRWLWPVHSQVARWMLRSDRVWLREITEFQRLESSDNGISGGACRSESDSRPA